MRGSPLRYDKNFFKKSVFGAEVPALLIEKRVWDKENN
jgi:hypothetical protein